MRRMVPAARRPGTVSVAVLAAVCCGSLAAGCGGGGDKPPARTSTEKARFVPANFPADVTGTNRWLPLRPGFQWVRIGGTDVGHRRVPHRVISTVTGVTKVVDGVRSRVLLDRDVDAGEIAQQSLDFLAEDRQRNVWYVGSYTEEYEGGRFVNSVDAWLAGVRGGEAGLLMRGDPRLGTPPYSVARPPGEDSDVAQVVQTGVRRCVPFKCYRGVLVIREGKSKAPDNEFKYFAPGVGQIDNVPRSASQHHDIERLVNLTQLTPQGLAEIDAEALRLDRHARVERPGVFGRSAVAKATQ